MYLVFDTETTGKPKDYKARMSDINNWPRVSQLAWAVYSPDGVILVKRSQLIKPDGWVIPTEKFFIDNNMSTERCEKEGIPILHVLSQLIANIKECEYLVAHNLQFDYNVLGAEMLRYGVKSDKRLKLICTMEESTEYCQLRGPKFGFKWPSLAELHNKLFACGFDGAHDAMADVLACGKCLFGLKEKGVITL